MMKAIITDDEPHCIETLNLLLKEYCPDVTVLERCFSAKQCMAVLNKCKPDLLFLDIEMPGMSGFEMLEQLPAIPFAIIFTTAYNQYAVKAIHFSALDYLMKPIDPQDLVPAVKKAKEQQQLPTAEQFQMLLKRVQDKDYQFNKIAVPTTEGYELIKAEQVIRCEANDNYTHLVLKDNKKITACRTLKEIEEQLSAFSFFVRVHHSYIVNLNEVTKYIRGEGGYVVMTDGSTVNVSRSRKEALLKYF